MVRIFVYRISYRPYSIFSTTSYPYCIERIIIVIKLFKVKGKEVRMGDVIQIKMDGHKYAFTDDYSFNTGVEGYTFCNSICELEYDGTVTVKNKFRTNRAGTDITDNGKLIALCNHDIGYYLIHNKAISKEYRKHFDECFLYDCDVYKAPFLFKIGSYLKFRLFGWIGL